MIRLTMGRAVLASPAAFGSRLRRRVLARRRAGQRRGVAGVVVGMVEGELRGWVSNLDDPSRVETIRCVGDQGRSLVFRPTFRSEAGCRELGTDRARGFAVPSDLLAGLGPSVSVCSETGVPFRNGRALRVPSPSRAPRASPQILFVHIPKTAGTSLRDALLGGQPPGDALCVYPDWALGVTLEDCLRIPPAQLARFRWLFGHFHVGLHHHAGPDARYATFIRDPLRRLRSNVRHHAAAGTGFVANGAAVRPSVFINDGFGEEFDNLMTRMIAGLTPAAVPLGGIGAAHVDLAIETIRRHFVFVGRRETLDADTRLLQARARLPACTPRRANVTAARVLWPEGEAEAIDWDGLAHRNRFDVMLHRRIIDEGLASRVLR